MGERAALQTIKDRKFEAWKHGLLDVSKRNKMLNYRKTRRTTIGILTPDLYSLFHRITEKEEVLTFRTVMDCSADQQIGQLFYLMDRIGAPVAFTRGEIVTDQPFVDAAKTLKTLRSKAKLSLDEQGINILYLSFGFLEWRQKPSDDAMLSPLVLVPVTLYRDDYISPYKISRADEDIAANPALSYVLRNDYGINLPDFETGKDDLRTYLENIEEVVRAAGWNVIREVNLGLLSFLKIVMYNDLEKYKERIFQNPVIAAFCGDPSGLPVIRDEWLDFDHDRTLPKETFQVVNADASQQDAILLSKKGISFVLQGPPGTGKSQTITNIIAEGLADGKKILFVSEKMAALSVVYNRLKEVNLAEYCLSLHNYKADRKTVIADLVQTLEAPRQTLKPGVMDFVDELEAERSALDRYFAELHKIREPLGRSLYDVLSELAALDAVPLWRMDICVYDISGEQYTRMQRLLKKYREFTKNYNKDIRTNPWYGTNLSSAGYDTRNLVNEEIQRVNPVLFSMSIVVDYLSEQYGCTAAVSWNAFYEMAADVSQLDLLHKLALQQTEYCRIHYPGMPGESSISEFLQRFYQTACAAAAQDNLLCELEKLFDSVHSKREEIRTGLDRLAAGKETVPEQHVSTVKESYAFWMREASAIETDEAELNAILDEAGACGISKRDLMTRYDRQVLSEKLTARCGELQEILSFLASFSESLREVTSVQEASETAEVMRSPYVVHVDLFDPESMEKFRSCIEQIEKIQADAQFEYDRMCACKADLLKEWTEEFLSLNDSSVYGRFKVDYTSFFKRLSGQYRRDKRTLSIMNRSSDGKVSDAQCLSGLTMLREYQDTCAQFESKKAEIVRLMTKMGFSMSELPGDWKEITEWIAFCRNLLMCRDRNSLTLQMMRLLSLSQPSRLSTVIEGKTLRDLVSPEVITRYSSLSMHYGDHDYDALLAAAKRQMECLRHLEQQIERMENRIPDIARIEGTIPIGEIRNDLEITTLKQQYTLYQELTALYRLYSKNERAYQERFSGVYKGIDSDWKKIRECMNEAIDLTSFGREPDHALYEHVCETADSPPGATSALMSFLLDKDELESWFPEGNQASLKSRFRQVCSDIAICNALEIGYGQSSHDRLEKYGISSDHDRVPEELTECFAPYYREDESAAANLMNGLRLVEFSVEIPAYIKALTAALSDFCSEQKLSMQQPNQDVLTMFDSWFPDQDLRAVPLQKLSQRVSDCSNMEELNSWITYREMERQANDMGIGTYLSYVMEQGISSRRILPIFRKSFLSKWYYEVIDGENIDVLRNFQSYEQETRIGTFKGLDHRQHYVAQARLSEKLSNEKPSGNVRLANAGDEVSVLRRESEKKRRVMPLRRLFREIPNLLQKLKPCFMMSPLSVSYFLDSEMYSFDMVIFDEASQILPEDAIGAIYRGKQVIIAGDTKQMPPTNFFSAASKNSDTEFDEDDDGYYDEILSESILDEANACLPSCTLLWHYRSRDESLIAFSNRNIYDNKLITFPNQKKDTDKGLEYVYVPDGYYEGKGRNCNVKEAQRCVRLVEEHIHCHPDRSLGIIAFSEKQQGVIEDAIADFRIQHPDYDDFFREDKEEPFFVKNLENVQGDERDTIIFSICYARNKDGRFYMRFGPLGHAGGERRLNVAITRAKYNVKLVGSILPTDINTNRTKAEGVKMLREYIFYAMQNDSGLPEGAGAAYRQDLFPEIIADFLNMNGYGVRRNVGASEYKIDIAVMRPDSQEEFCAGIECDGPNYSMARTARDRDVLRRDIMTSMGWNMYHVWSAAWVVNPTKEEEKLLAFLQKASKGSYVVSGDKTVPLSVHRMEEKMTEAQETEDVHDMMDKYEAGHSEQTLEFADYEISNPWEAEYVPADGNTGNLKRRILYVLEREQPMQEDLLYKRLATVFGREKVTEPIRRTIYGCLLQMQKDTVTMRGGFIYLNSAPRVIPRRPRSWDEPRDIEQISPEEIQAALYAVAEFAMSLTPENLISETARAFGYARTGPKIKKALSNGLDEMLKTGRLKKADGRIYVGDNP